MKKGFKRVRTAVYSQSVLEIFEKIMENHGHFAPEVPSFGENGYLYLDVIKWNRKALLKGLNTHFRQCANKIQLFLKQQ